MQSKTSRSTPASVVSLALAAIIIVVGRLSHVQDGFSSMDLLGIPIAIALLWLVIWLVLRFVVKY